MTEIVCDFCRSPDPVWEYMAGEVMLPGAVHSFGPWCACDTCRELIDMGDRAALARRAANVTGMPVRVNYLVHDCFFEAKKGPARPIRMTLLHGRMFQR